MALRRIRGDDALAGGSGAQGGIWDQPGSGRADCELLTPGVLFRGPDIRVTGCQVWAQEAVSNHTRHLRDFGYMFGTLIQLLLPRPLPIRNR